MTRAERRRIRRGRLESRQQGQGHGERRYVPNVRKGTIVREPWREVELWADALIGEMIGTAGR